jgi:hypothetical protein
MLTPEQILRFDAKLDKSRGACGCWLWTATKNSYGYGHCTIDKRSHKAHRVAFQRYVGPLRKGEFTLHLCDTPACCNPLHLVRGTHEENMRYMRERRRGVYGEASNLARLSDDQVRAIRADTRLQREIAQTYGIKRATVSAIKIRRSWAHI